MLRLRKSSLYFLKCRDELRKESDQLKKELRASKKRNNEDPSNEEIKKPTGSDQEEEEKSKGQWKYSLLVTRYSICKEPSTSLFLRFGTTYLFIFVKLTLQIFKLLLMAHLFESC